jgi:copper resistance protein B
MPQPDWPSPVADQTIFDLLLIELLEYRPNPGQGAVEWDAVGWWGTDLNRLWLKSEGEWALGAGPDVGVEVQALYGRLVAPFYDFQVGLRADRVWGEASPVSRVHGVIGLQGLSPGYFEVEPALFVDQEGRLAARLTASRDLLLTQRAVLQARMETNAALQSAEAFGVGAGWNDLELGVRLRYEFWREFAPYVGVNWNMRFGETAAIAQRHGEAPSHLSIVAGVRAWY